MLSLQASSLTSMTDSTMSLNVITVTLNMGKQYTFILTMTECYSDLRHIVMNVIDIELPA